MTRLETQEWLERYAALHPSSSRDEVQKALELHVKDEERRKRTNAKRTATIAKKAAQEESAGMVERLLEQERKIAELEQALKDRDAVIAELKRCAAGRSMFKVRHEIAAVPDDDLPTQAAANQPHELDIITRTPGAAECIYADLKHQVNRSVIYYHQANVIAAQLLLKERFTSRDQPHGWNYAQMKEEKTREAIAKWNERTESFRKQLKKRGMTTAYEDSLAAKKRNEVKP